MNGLPHKIPLRGGTPEGNAEVLEQYRQHMIQGSEVFNESFGYRSLFMNFILLRSTQLYNMIRLKEAIVSVDVGVLNRDEQGGQLSAYKNQQIYTLLLPYYVNGVTGPKQKLMCLLKLSTVPSNLLEIVLCLGIACNCKHNLQETVRTHFPRLALYNIPTKVHTCSVLL